MSRWTSLQQPTTWSKGSEIDSPTWTTAFLSDRKSSEIEIILSGSPRALIFGIKMDLSRRSTAANMPRVTRITLFFPSNGKFQHAFDREFEKFPLLPVITDGLPYFMYCSYFLPELAWVLLQIWVTFSYIRVAKEIFQTPGQRCVESFFVILFLDEFNKGGNCKIQLTQGP